MDKPILMEWSKPSRTFPDMIGKYDPKNQKWKGDDVRMAATTWSRTSTTGIITFDPDEDKDD